MSGAKRLYLGTPNKPKKERVEMAIYDLRKRIREQQMELVRLEQLIGQGGSKFEVKPPPYYELVVFDVDGVIYEKPWHDIGIAATSEKVAVSTWDILFQELGIYNIHEKLLQNFEKGFFKNYMEWSKAACQVLKSVGLDKRTFFRIINRRPLTQGAVEVFKELHKYNVKIALITGSFKAIAERAARELGGADYIVGHCEFIFNSDGLLERWELQPVDYEDKVKLIQNIAIKNRIPLKKCAYIGDDVNDINAFNEAGLAIAFNCKKVKALEAVDVIIESRDLTTILPHLFKHNKKADKRCYK